MIINLTQHQPTAEQIAAGVVEPEDKLEVKALLTFTEIPSKYEISDRAYRLALIARESKAKAAMIGGAGYLMGPLERALKELGIQPLHSFTERKATEEVQSDGSVKKGQVFVHVGWVEV